MLEAFVASFAAEFQRFALERATRAIMRILGEALDGLNFLPDAAAGLEPAVRDGALNAARRLRAVLSRGTIEPDDVAAVVDGLLGCLAVLGPRPSCLTHGV